MSEEPRTRELDELTLVRAQRGEPEALKTFVLLHQRAVFALLSRMLGRSHRVEDLAQETFLRAFKALPSFRADGPARLSTWVLTIATRLALDELRARRHEEPLSPSWPDGRRSDETAERRDIARHLEAALDELGPPFRAVFVLRELHELEYEEIASALEIDVAGSPIRSAPTSTASPPRRRRASPPSCARSTSRSPATRPAPTRWGRSRCSRRSSRSRAPTTSRPPSRSSPASAPGSSGRRAIPRRSRRSRACSGCWSGSAMPTSATSAPPSAPTARTSSARCATAGARTTARPTAAPAIDPALSLPTDR